MNMPSRRRRRRRSRRGSGNCLACNFARYSSVSLDYCEAADPNTRALHTAIMAAGRVGMTDTPLMAALRLATSPFSIGRVFIIDATDIAPAIEPDLSGWRRALSISYQGPPSVTPS